MAVRVAKHLPLLNGLFNLQLVLIKVSVKEVVIESGLSRFFAPSWRPVRVQFFNQRFVNWKSLILTQHQVSYASDHTDERSYQQKRPCQRVSMHSLLHHYLLLRQNNIQKTKEQRARLISNRCDIIISVRNVVRYNLVAIQKRRVVPEVIKEANFRYWHFFAVSLAELRA